jgi:AbrB family looped-hinge helix DNA binding protein
MHFEITRLSSRGQLVIPDKTRKLMGLDTGMKFAVFNDGKNILLRPIAPPDMKAFEKLCSEADKVTREAKAMKGGRK